MAKYAPEVIEALRNTAINIESSKDYQWGHMGSCNCGFLAQEVTNLTKSEIHTRAMEGYGDWNEQLNDYCPSSGYRMDDLISQLIDFGFDTADLKHLEKLSDPEVLRCFPLKSRHLKYNSKEDVFKYINAMADKLEREMLDQIKLPPLAEVSAPIQQVSLAPQ